LPYRRRRFVDDSCVPIRQFFSGRSECCAKGSRQLLRIADLLMKAGQLLAVAVTQAAAFEGRQKKNRRLMARMGNVEGTLRASQANDGFGGKDGKNSPAECGVKIYPQKSAILMPIDVRIIDIPNRLNETIMTCGGHLRKAVAQTLDIFRFDGQIDI